MGKRMLPRHDADMAQQIKEVDGEIDMRRSVYPRLVAAGKMAQSDADYRIEIMRAVLSTLQAKRGHRRVH